MYIHIFYVGSYRHMFVYVQLTEDKKERDRNEIEREGAGLLYGTVPTVERYTLFTKVRRHFLTS